ncbi:hypothetical protein GW17_00022423, partial [Ensete ventricosum]
LRKGFDMPTTGSDCMLYETELESILKEKENIDVVTEDGPRPGAGRQASPRRPKEATAGAQATSWRRGHKSRRQWQRAGVAPLLRKNTLATPKSHERLRELATMVMTEVAMLGGSMEKSTVVEEGIGVALRIENENEKLD